MPQTVDAVTSDELQKRSITQFTDIQSIVPGVTLQQSGAVYNTTMSVRGLSYNPTAGTFPSVGAHLNDAFAAPSLLFGALYDIGEVEVLRGPQCTARGDLSPSGAMTMTTQKPDLARFGGYEGATFTNLGTVIVHSKVTRRQQSKMRQPASVLTHRKPEAQPIEAC